MNIADVKRIVVIGGVSDGYEPTGDQPQAIARLAEGVLRGDRDCARRGDPTA